MKKPKISIIVPVYNVEDYLEDCIESLVQQSYSNIEIICINDGSTDSSLQILRKYEAKYSNIKVISTKNSGLAATRNLGLELATGDFVTFVDSDDWLDRKTISTIYEEGFFENSEIDIICFGLCRVIKDVKVPYRNYDKTKIRKMTRACSLILSGEACGKLYRREFLSKNHIIFPVGLYYEDITFHWSCIGFARKIATMKNVFYNYRMREESIMGASDQKKPGMAIHHIYNLRELYFVWKNNGFLKNHRNLFLFVFETYVLQGYKFLNSKDRDKFVTELNELVSEIDFKPQKFTLTNDLIKGNKIFNLKYKWAKSLRKKILAMNLPIVL